MSQLTIERISPKALGRLKELATRQGRSEEEVAGEILEFALGADAAGRGEAARRIRLMTPKGVVQSDSTEIIRRLRDE
jgi:hypothetical protein